MAKATQHEIEVQTVAEIGRLAAEITRERQEKVEARRDLYGRRAAGDTPSPPMTPDELAARQFALEKLNGSAPASMRLPAGDDTDRILATQIRGLDMVLDVLNRQDMTARAAEAYRRPADGADEWRDLCRDIILTAEHLLALERRADAFRRGLGGEFTPDNLPLAPFIGLGRSLIDHRPSADPLGRMRDAALREKIVTPAEIRGARDD